MIQLNLIALFVKQMLIEHEGRPRHDSKEILQILRKADAI